MSRPQQSIRTLVGIAIVSAQDFDGKDWYGLAPPLQYVASVPVSLQWFLCHWCCSED